MAEMLRPLDDVALEAIATSFRWRILNVGGAAEDAVWDDMLAALLPKILKPVFVEQFRPIGLIPVLQKLFFICVGVLADTLSSDWIGRRPLVISYFGILVLIVFLLYGMFVGEGLPLSSV